MNSAGRVASRSGLIVLLTLFANVLLGVPSFAQKNEKNEAAALDAKVIQLYQAGKYADAIPLAQRSVAIRERTLGPNHPDLAGSLNLLAALYLGQGRYTDAEPLFQRALAIREKAFGPEHLAVAESLSNLAALYDGQGRYADAEPLYKRSLAIREKALGPDHPDVAATLNNLARLYVDQGRAAVAEPLYKRALSIREKALGPDNPAVAQALNNLAELYWNQGRYADAEPAMKRALAIIEKSLGPDHPNVVPSLNALATLYQTQGRYADAESLFKRALAVGEKALGPEHPDVAALLGNLAVVYQGEGRYADAETAYRRSLAIREKVLGQNHPDVATALSNLATLYQVQSRYADAEPLARRALAIRDKALGPDHPDVAAALTNLAELYTSQGRYADAEPLYKRALVIDEKALGPDHPSVAMALNNLAALYQKQGRFADALPFAQRVIGNGRALPAVALPVLFGAAHDKLIPAQTALDDSLNVVERAAQTAAASAIGQLAVRLAAGSDRLAQLVRKDQDLAAEADTLDKTILAAVSKEPSQRNAAAEQKIRERLAAIGKERDALQKLFAGDFPDYAALSSPQPLTAKEIQALLSDDEALLVFAAAGDKESYVFALTRDSVDWKPIPLGGDALAQRVAAFRRGLDVDMMADQDALDAMKVKRELFDLGTANALYTSLIGPVEPLVKGKHSLLVVPFGPLTALPFHLLVTEQPPLPKPTVSSGSITAQDMAPYRDAAWLAKRQAVSVLPSVASLKALRQFARKDPAAKPMIGFGDPVFGAISAPAAQRAVKRPVVRSLATGSYADFWRGAGVDRSRLSQALPQLPDTADELKAVALRLGAPFTDIHLGRDASEASVKRAPLADYRIVYFATHGLVAGDIKGVAEPSLALTIPAQPSELDDGLLTASEVAQLKLNADWVVLSACNTIAGDKPGAEALSGLARAFFYAGARALLVSHWAVASDAATRLTTATFDILKADPKLGRAEALRRAMQAYLDDPAQPRNAYPAIWGPFSIIGEGAAR